MSETFLIQYDELPISVNNYLKPASRIVNGKPVTYLYETKEAKDFKKRFQAYLKREVKKQNWNMEVTKEGHWVLECVFIQSRTNQDNNNYYKILCDALTDVVIDDDKNILVRTQRVLYDAKSPRFVAVLKPVEYIGIFKNRAEYGQFLDHNCSTCKKDSNKCAILRKAREGRIQQEIHIDGSSYKCSKKKA
ncbi:RusA family crossover junction endodeoxyribonuclease [Peribacillus asahii]|uniref:RusA family crossover junction endodeoxyribonuclease n=1 Tax=Peribacillus asahii TaxID=228899 RepID=UPI00381F68C1